MERHYWYKWTVVRLMAWCLHGTKPLSKLLIHPYRHLISIWTIATHPWRILTLLGQEFWWNSIVWSNNNKYPQWWMAMSPQCDRPYWPYLGESADTLVPPRPQERKATKRNRCQPPKRNHCQKQVWRQKCLNSRCSRLSLYYWVRVTFYV